MTRVREIVAVRQYRRSRDSVLDIATGYELDGRGGRVRAPVGSRIFSFPQLPDWLWDPPSLLCLLYNGYWGLFLRGYSGRGVKLTTHLQIVPRSRKYGPIHPLPQFSLVSLVTSSHGTVTHRPVCKLAL
jgi:hypothetical protein